MAKKDGNFETTVQGLFPDSEYKSPSFVPAEELKEVVVHTDHPEVATLDGVYVAKKVEHGNIVFVLVGRYTGKLPKAPEKNDYAFPTYQRSKDQVVK